MTRVPIPNFHNARLSVVQSFVREMICQKSAGGPRPGLCADHPAMRATGATLLRIEQSEFLGASAACDFYDAQFAALRLESGAAGFPVEDCGRLLAKYALARALGDRERMQQIQSEFVDSQCDPGWLAAAITWLEYYWDDKAPDYVLPTEDAPVPFPLPPPASTGEPLRVGILGDWGTGEEEALSVLDQLMQQKPDVIIHVGDIYYSGTHDECVANFLRPIHKARAKYQRNIPVYNLPGNHDYYSGGQGFYGILPRLNLKADHGSIQKHSFFCLQNDSWQLEGMDTGYQDHDLNKVADDTTRLRKAEADWHERQLEAAGGRKVILFSHHQLYSAFTTIGKVGSAGPQYRNPHLTKNLDTWRKKGKPNIVAWLWGHEHLLEIYALPGGPNVDLPVLGRCIGNSAFPVFKDQGDYNPVTNDVPLEPDPPNKYVQTATEDQIYRHGYLLLALGAECATATYYQVKDPGAVSGATSEVLWTESIPAKPQA